ncbi:hypothetical protein SGUI_0556 [Serinicoccus hydrothermalis]|uniref:PIN domain-containing protein n=1 Tax=Serinicoccus hydrothermalis TaxID=1758689 RepID=A0A1B1N940_9MICO|nr:type II toxin-antitoxin system VapC family toxin [Serinicoccus hydrothermalis]ANS77952.1 hypothetical protein SGUI_0556 [Serinicoccus hydrothermalis]
MDALRESRRDQEGPARAWLADHDDEALALSVFVMAEMLVGAERHADPARERARVERACGDLPMVLPDARLAGTYATVHAGLASLGTPVAVMDLLIGCTALNAQAPLLTANPSHFAKIPALRVLTYR